MVVDAFTIFDNLYHGCKEQNQPKFEPLEDTKTHFPIDQRQHETIMESMITKTSTPLFEGYLTNMFVNHVVIAFEDCFFMDKLFSLLT
jgi:hypothetical protein